MRKSNLYLYLFQLLFLIPVFYYWFDSIGMDFENINLLSLFPLFGLVAFVMMWFHLMVAYFKRTRPELFNYKSFYRITSNIVLILIIFHPLIVFAKSYEYNILAIDFNGQSGRLFVLFGIIALTFFFFYEILERLRETSIIKKNWEFVVAFNRAAFALVYIHALYLGQHLQSGWLRELWIFFGATTLGYFAWAYLYEIRLKHNTNKSSEEQGW